MNTGTPWLISGQQALVPTSSFWRKAFWHLRDHVLPHPRNNFQPHVLHHRTLAWVSLLLVTIKIVTIAWVSFGPVAEVASSAITSDSVLSLTNQSRHGAGITTLRYNATLQKSAQAKADDLLARQYFAHNTPDGKTPWEFFKATGYAYISAGENLAVHFTDVEPLQDAWMNSPGHRANIMNANFEEMGVGISRGRFEGHDTIFVVEHFGAPAAPGVRVQGSPTPVAKKATSSKRVQASTARAEGPAAKPLSLQPAADVSEVPSGSAVDTRLAVVPERKDLTIRDILVRITDRDLIVSTETSDNAARVMLLYGAKARLFRPTAEDRWQVSVPLDAVRSEVVSVRAYDLYGKTVTKPLATLAPSFELSFLSLGKVSGAEISLLGQRVDPKGFEHSAYSLLITLLLTSLLIALAVHKHLHHIRLVANTAFVVVFACMLWLI